MKYIQQPAHAPFSWTRALWLRIRTLWFLKMIGTVAGIAAFFAVYFWTMGETAGRAVTMPVTWIDQWIGVNEFAFIPYVSLWVYVSGFAPAFALNAGALRAYATGALAIALVGIAFFWLFPKTESRLRSVWIGPGFRCSRFLKESDASGNALTPRCTWRSPFTARTSFRASSEASARRAGPELSTGSGAWPWSTTTLATRQHVFIDVAGGILAACLGRSVAWSPLGRAFHGSAPVAPKYGSPLKILVVEDDTDLAQALASALHDHSMVVDIASSLREAMNLAIDADHDILIVDRGLPDGDGLALIEFLRRSEAGATPALVLTAMGEVTEGRVRSLDRGADDYLGQAVLRLTS